MTVQTWHWAECVLGLLACSEIEPRRQKNLLFPGAAAATITGAIHFAAFDLRTDAGDGCSMVRRRNATACSKLSPVRNTSPPCAAP
jgi:hypothetical protein